MPNLTIVRFSKTTASYFLVFLAALLCFIAMVLALVYVTGKSNQVGYILMGFLIVSVLTEIVLQKTFERKVKPRIKQSKQQQAKRQTQPTYFTDD